MVNTLVFPQASLEVDSDGDWHWFCNPEALKEEEVRDWFFREAGAHCYRYVNANRILVAVPDERLAVFDRDTLLYDVSLLVPVVATVGGSLLDWAAYYGLPEKSPEREARYLITGTDLYSPLGTAQRGDKLPQGIAETFFPEFKHLKYRR